MPPESHATAEKYEARNPAPRGRTISLNFALDTSLECGIITVKELALMKSQRGGRSRMPRKKTPVLTGVELQFMEVIWEHGPCTAVEVRRRLRRRGLAESTVRTMLQILERKGYVEHGVEGRTYVYRARVDRQQTRGRFLRDMVGRVFAGSPELVVKGLIDSGELSQKNIARIRQMLKSAQRKKK